MGKLLRLASTSTKRINLDEDGEDWIEVKSDITKRTFAELAQSLPSLQEGEDSPSLTIGQAVEFQKNLFETFVVGWSLVDDNGQALAPAVETYLELSREAAEAVDTAVAEHFDALNPSKDEQKKSA